MAKANLPLRFWEEIVVKGEVFYSYHCNILKWIGYIDDILLIWKGTKEEALEFVEKLNNNEINIKLTLNMSEISVSFLDLLIINDGKGKLTTKNFKKETATNSL
ncbi:hypothetical protein XELAEV_18003444mg [Xenopus laevis]|nr:hypothetical protein XELAEV_18003444mg [Xenopus laevis]